ncbi:MAG TPA: hypothetical protein VIF62_31485, partial [Labilithrix sp.]
RARDRLYGMLDAAIGAGGEDGVRALATSMNHGNIEIGDCAGWMSYLADVGQNGSEDLAKAASAANAYLASH